VSVHGVNHGRSASCRDTRQVNTRRSSSASTSPAAQILLNICSMRSHVVSNMRAMPKQCVPHSSSSRSPTAETLKNVLFSKIAQFSVDSTEQTPLSQASPATAGLTRVCSDVFRKNALCVGNCRGSRASGVHEWTVSPTCSLQRLNSIVSSRLLVQISFATLCAHRYTPPCR
jgi:hypothetical protein